MFAVGNAIRRWIKSPTGILTLTFTVLYLLSVEWYRFASYRDPTSVFFDSRHGYDRNYSLQRAKEADKYLASVQNATHVTKVGSEAPLICIGIVTVARRDEQYVPLTVGSLLDGLEEEERKTVFLNLMFGNTEPSKHPIFAEKWVDLLPDRVLEYKKDNPDFELIRGWEEKSQLQEKSIYDYTYLLKNCYETGAAYVAMIEDDALATEGWYPRVTKALDAVNSEISKPSRDGKWLYLRLFFTEEYLGWNREEWQRYLVYSFGIWAAVTMFMVGAKIVVKPRMDHISYPVIGIGSIVLVGASVGLHFMAGRQTMWPMSPGIHEMNRFGCCSQGLVFPRSIIPFLLEKADWKVNWLVDTMIEHIANTENIARFVIVPAVLQHIGGTSSKGTDFDTMAKKLWNFGFEDLSPG